MDYIGRWGRVRSEIEHQRLSAFLVSHLPNIRYLCGFTGSAGALLITAADMVFFTDGRYTQQAKQEVKGARVKIGKNSALTLAGEWLKRSNIRRVGIESPHMTVGDRTRLAKLLRGRVKLVEAPPVVEAIRMVKDPDEIAKIRAACQLGVTIFHGLLKSVRAGKSESQVAGELEFAARQAGAEQMAFPTIVAAGARSALPHGRASNAVVPSRAFVLFDFGVLLAGYCSDMTRTVYLGRPQSQQRQVYEAVREAQQVAIEAVKPGVTAGEVDQTARKLLQKRKLAKFFTHSTGHGLGLEIHEAPRIGAGQKEVLRAGMVITIEPGVYLPGKWGIRIEDTVVVTQAACEILTNCPKDLLTL